MIQMRDAEQADKYFDQELSQSDYYVSDQELTGTILGKVANRLGIVGEATGPVFHALCQNLHPLTGKNLTARTVEGRTVGYDINFHVPKSVSALHVLSKDNHILDAFRDAVHETMADIEADSKARVRKGGHDSDRDTGELVWGEFIHQTARPVDGSTPDPHLHAHCVTFNVTYDKTEKQYKAGQFRDIKRDMPYYQARFHLRLADKLAALGYRIRRTKNAWEVEGVPEEVIRLFAKRTDAIGRAAKEHGITDAKEKDKLGARTRSKKQKGLTMAELKKDWRRQIIALGMADGETGRDPLRYNPALSDTVTARECVDHALTHSFERASVMQDRRVLESAYRHALGKTGATVDQITGLFRRDRQIIHVQDGSRLLCTTKEVLGEENRMVQFARAGKGRVAPLYSRLPEIKLDGQHKEVVGNVLTSTDQIDLIMGRAGTGKTTLMKELVRLIEKMGKSVFLTAPTSQAARGVLRAEGFADAETVAKLLASQELQQKIRNGVLIVDEAGLLGVKDMLALQELVRRQNARLILCGDTRQHASVVRGDALRILHTVAGITPANVSKIFRQKKAVYREAVQALSDGDAKTGFFKLESMGAIRQIDPGHPYDGLVKEYVATLRQGKTGLVVCPTHREGEGVTAAIRHKLRKAGLIGKKEVTVSRLVNLSMTEAEKADARNYQESQVLQFGQNREGIKRGSRWIVVAVKRKSLTLENNNGETVDLPLDRVGEFEVYQQTEISLSIGDRLRITRNGFDADNKRLNNGQMLDVVSMDDDTITLRHPEGKTDFTVSTAFGHLAHAHCITSHASQGKTVDHVFIAQPAATFPATDLKQLYVSISRGREGVQLYTDDKEALLHHAAEARDRMSGSELLGKRQRSHPMTRQLAMGKSRQPKITAPTPVKSNPMRSHAPKLSL
ncbi:MAG TPA: MobF family relaxase [Puia sp.]|uniref:MobF family relaxase n=1 Tax=Puia sp. TaxID=2045100 RepID=UPI002BE53B45|nr:MobF family relaxase [Puia sp.]HVU93734.1 MobF family relaxase [Puia sp.]